MSIEHHINTGVKNRIYITNDIAVVPPAKASGFGMSVSPQTFTVRLANGGSGAILAQDSNGIVVTSGNDLGVILNTIVSGIADHSVITFQSATYSGTTTFVNGGHRGLRMFGNGSTVPIKFKFDGSGHILATSNCIVSDFNFSGNNAGLIVDNTGWFRVQNSRFNANIESISFETSELNTEYWSLDNVHFNDSMKPLTFKTPTGSGTGSYVNGLANHVSFNTGGGMTSGFTYIDVQQSGVINECKFTNTRMWFKNRSGIGIHLRAGGSATRCQFSKIYFENFANASGSTQAIIIASGSQGSPMFIGRPLFGGTAYDTKFSNSNAHHLHSIGYGIWRDQSNIVVGTSDSFSTATALFDDTDYAGLPNVYVTIGGSVAAGETISVRFTMNLIADDGVDRSLTKTYKETGTFALTANDARALLPVSYQLIDNITVDAKTSESSTSATVLVGAVGGGGSMDSTIMISGLTYYGAVTTSHAPVPASGGAVPDHARGWITIKISGADCKLPFY